MRVATGRFSILLLLLFSRCILAENAVVEAQHSSFLTLEAEDIPDHDIFNCTKESTYLGSTHGGASTVVTLGEAGSWIQWRVAARDITTTTTTAMDDGKLELKFRYYANGDSTDRTCDVHINGVHVNPLLFPMRTIYDWYPRWSSTTLTIDAEMLLAVQEIVVRLTTVAGSVGPSIDYLRVSVVPSPTNGDVSEGSPAHEDGTIDVETSEDEERNDSPSTSLHCFRGLRSQRQMYRGDRRCSQNGNHELILTADDGRLVLRNKLNGTVIWDAQISGAGYLAMEADGNLVAKNDQNQSLWESGTSDMSKPGTVEMLVLNDGSLELRRDSWAIWCVNKDGVGCDGHVKPTGELKIVVFSVLSADSSIIIFPTGRIMMVDSATEARFGDRVLPFLQRHGIRHLDYYVETHTDLDHIGGASLLRSNGIVDRNTEYWNWDTFKYGDSFELDGTNWFISNARDISIYGDDPNPNSISYRIEFNGFVYSSTGDEYNTAQDRYLADYPSLVPAHVRNTAHHMWGPVSPEFLLATNAYLYIISCSVKVRKSPAFMLDFLGATKQLKTSGGRFRESLITEEVGHVFVRAADSENWSYDTCPEIDTCMMDL